MLFIELEPAKAAQPTFKNEAVSAVVLPSLQKTFHASFDEMQKQIKDKLNQGHVKNKIATILIKIGIIVYRKPLSSKVI